MSIHMNKTDIHHAQTQTGMEHLQSDSILRLGTLNSKTLFRSAEINYRFLLERQARTYNWIIQYNCYITMHGNNAEINSEEEKSKKKN